MVAVLVAPLAAVAGLAFAAAPASAYTATYTDVHGHTIDVRVNPPTRTAADEARDRLIIDVLGSLAHGSEMDLLTVDLKSADDEHNTECGNAPACYSYGAGPGTLHIRGFDTGKDPRKDADNVPLTSTSLPRGLIAHEYGHHLANHRRNDGPLKGGGLANGTKRWASYVGICRLVRAGRLGKDYVTSPAEGFAESYRALHFRENLDFWFVHRLLKPDRTALRLIRKDALNPYNGPRRKRLHGRLGPNRPDRHRKKLRTPLDGKLKATLKTTGSLRARLTVIDGRKRVAKGKGRKQRLSHRVCGARKLQIAVRRVRGVGRYTVNVTRP